MYPYDTNDPRGIDTLVSGLLDISPAACGTNESPGQTRPPSRTKHRGARLISPPPHNVQNVKGGGGVRRCGL